MENLRELLKPLTYQIARPFLKIHPNIISIISIFAHLPGVYFYAIGNAGLGTLFLFGALMDKIDGDVAKITGKTSQFGGVLDATIDRFTEGLVLMGIGIGGLVPWWLLFIIFNTSVCISYIKAKAEAATATTKVGKNQFSVGIAQRGDRVVMIVLGSILAGIFSNNAILVWVMVALLIMQIITLLWRGFAIYGVLNDLEKSKK